MFTHLILYARYEHISFVYHFSSADSTAQPVMDEIDRLLARKDVPGYAYSVHGLGTDEASFASVQHMDPYFQSAREIADLDQFLDYCKYPDQLVAQFG